MVFTFKKLPRRQDAADSVASAPQGSDGVQRALQFDFDTSPAEAPINMATVVRTCGAVPALAALVHAPLPLSTCFPSPCPDPSPSPTTSQTPTAPADAKADPTLQVPLTLLRANMERYPTLMAAVEAALCRSPPAASGAAPSPFGTPGAAVSSGMSLPADGRAIDDYIQARQQLLSCSEGDLSISSMATACRGLPPLVGRLIRVATQGGMIHRGSRAAVASESGDEGTPKWLEASLHAPTPPSGAPTPPSGAFVTPEAQAAQGEAMVEWEEALWARIEAEFYTKAQEGEGDAAAAGRLEHHLRQGRPLAALEIFLRARLPFTSVNSPRRTRFLLSLSEQDAKMLHGIVEPLAVANFSKVPHAATTAHTRRKAPLVG
ncbi:hypothetical protein CYMTET_35100, partial [Cymbomonas tetramitiformis]